MKWKVIVIADYIIRKQKSECLTNGNTWNTCTKSQSSQLEIQGSLYAAVSAPLKPAQNIANYTLITLLLV